jgi:hypothetical protein
MSNKIPETLYTDFSAILSNHKTSIHDIEASGWKMECNEGGCFWRHQDTQAVVPIQHWVKQWSSQMATSARETLRRQMRDVLGL